MRKILTGSYKIHLMPKSENDFMYIFEQILISLQDENVREHITSLKYMVNADFTNLQQSITRGDETMPIMVIYPAHGKEHAEFVLNYFYSLFKDIRGLNITPRYNKKVTSLIYYAQGEGNLKSGKYKTYYDKKHNKAFYKSDFVEPGIHTDHSLKIHRPLLDYLKFWRFLCKN